MRLLAPAIAVSVLAGGSGAEGFAGLIAAGIGLGSAIGLTVAARAYRNSRIEQSIGIGMIALVAGAVVLASAPVAWLALGSSLVVGFGYGLAFATITTFIQASVEEGLRGRVLSVHTLVHLGSRPLYTPIAGSVAAAGGILAAVLLFAAPAGALATALLARRIHVVVALQPESENVDAGPT
jgi:MFS family permease